MTTVPFCRSTGLLALAFTLLAGGPALAQARQPGPAGTYLLVAQPRDRAQTSQTVVVTGNEEVTVLVGKVTQPQNGGPPK